MSQTLAFQFRHRYNLPPTDPRFLDATEEEVAVDYWAHHYFDNPASEIVEDDEFDAEAIQAQWAQEAEEGELPNDFEDVP